MWMPCNNRTCSFIGLPLCSGRSDRPSEKVADFPPVLLSGIIECKQYGAADGFVHQDDGVRTVKVVVVTGFQSAEIGRASCRERV